MNSLHRTVIFGATSAIAQAVARRLVAQGASVYCVGRNPQKLEALLADLRVRAAAGQLVAGEAADLNDHQRHTALLSAAEVSLGGVDAILIAHGTLSDQKLCEASVETTMGEISNNALSAVSLLTLAANLFESRKAGVIAAISSVAGDRGRQSNYVYGAAKGMLTIFMQGLCHRMARHGVAVVNIKPGFVDTPMTAALDKSGPLWATPDAIAKGVLSAMAKGRSEAYLPWFWRPIMTIIRHVPTRIFNRTSL